MKQPKIEVIVMAKLFPYKKDTDPSNWSYHVTHNLVREVRLETIRFFGSIDSNESDFPGLDYTNPAHRVRLSYFTNHRRLFRAFDELRLTDGEIQKLCRWEGTRWAREVYEAHASGPIEDTTYDDVVDYRHRRTTVIQDPQVLPQQRKDEESMGDADMSGHDMESADDALNKENIAQMDWARMDRAQGGSGEESDDEIQQSVGVELNQRLLAATEARARGEDATLDPDWEQWLKEAVDRGSLPNLPHMLDLIPSVRADTPRTPVYWGRDIPAYLSDDPTPVMAAIQARLPPPPQFFPGVLSTPSDVSTILTSPSAPPAS